MICEMCGKDVPQTREVIVDGARLSVCQSCSKFGEMSGSSASSRPGAPVTQSVIDQRLERRERRMQSKDIYAGTTTIEIVDDYGGVIRRAREAKGMDQKEFANLIQEKQGILAKVESNSLIPDDKLVRKIEKALDIKLTEAVQAGGTVGGGRSDKMTLGNFIRKE
ncbi:MAG: multiprotein bridging factor aMBF1 [Thermoplasmata archaeon]|nr:multiprotein bridging factor aMBF1 [Thermoplasmata archaeon]